MGPRSNQCISGLLATSRISEKSLACYLIAGGTSESWPCGQAEPSSLSHRKAEEAEESRHRRGSRRRSRHAEGERRGQVHRQIDPERVEK